MSTLKPSVHSTILLTLLLLLGACAAYQTSGVSPAPSGLASVTTASGTVVIFDTLPAPQISGDTIYGRQDGVPCAIPTSDVVVTRWVAASGEQGATHATAGHGRPAGLELAAVGQGAHVRITAPSVGWNGTTKDVAAVHGDTLLLRRAGGLLGLILSPKPVPLSAVTTLEVSRNHGAHTAALAIGSLVGGVAGALAGYSLRNRTPCDSGLAGLGCGINRGFQDVGVTLLGGSVGALLGTLIANAAVPERWTLVGLHQPHAGLVPLPRRRVGLGVALAF